MKKYIKKMIYWLRIPSIFHWFYAIRKISFLLEQVNKLTNEVNALTNDVNGITKNPELPFANECEFNSLLPLAELQVGKKVSSLNSDDKSREFYTYFSELGGEYSKEIIRKQYEFYLKYIPRYCDYRFLDIGCGAGEFLSFLGGHNIPAVGVDLDENEVERAKNLGLSVFQNDALSFLNNTNEMFSGVSLLQVIEHVPPEHMVELVRIIAERLVPGGVLLVETINLKQQMGFNSFYIDPTHTRPVSETYLGFLMEWSGFEDIKLVYSLPTWCAGLDVKDISKLYFNYTLIGKKLEE